MTRYQIPIRSAGLSPKSVVRAGIQYGMKFAEWEACIAAGLDLHKWVDGLYPKWFMADTVAWYELHNLVSVHQHDAAVRKR